MTNRFAATALLAALAATACSARKLPAEAKTACTRCHGGQDNTSGAPPITISTRSAGAHTAHVNAGVTAGGCQACHPDPRSDSARHMDGTVEVELGSVATANGTLPARYDAATGTCSSVWCHGAFTGGNAANAPRWTDAPGSAPCGTCHGSPGSPIPPLPASHPPLAAGAGLTSCTVCHPQTMDAAGALRAGGAHANGTIDVDPAARHPAGWLVASSADFHGLAAARGLGACWRCHVAKGAASVAAVVCAGCHDTLAGGRDWTVTCNTCHGSAQNAAPPRDTTGHTETTALGVGAHQAHLQSAIAPPFGCEFCHVTPANVLDAGHLDGRASVTAYTGTDPIWSAAAHDPGFDASTATCASAYCHGAFRQGNAANAPQWTNVGQGEAACGTCHGVPPPSPHPAVSGGLADCSVCHQGTVDPGGQLIPPASGGLHLNGVIDATGHDATWLDSTSTGFHAYSANAGLAACMRCHGADLSGGATGVACAQCHGAAWRTSCTMCHGGTASTSGAPPRATWGNNVPADSTNVRIGAHTAHLSSQIAPAFGCAACHVTPTSALDPGHLGSATASVDFAALATTAGATSASWNRQTATCSATYCHGSTLPGGPAASPPWTSSGQGGCGSCHGLPPPSPHPAVASDLTGCIACHGKTVDSAGRILPPSSGGAHLNGAIDGGHQASWIDQASPNFHAYTANRGLASCATCHGASLQGQGNVPGCAQCHTAGWATNCTMCHGGGANGTGAPPKATWGNTLPADQTNLRIGAHTVHVTGTSDTPAFDCGVCHVKPSSAFDPGHIDSGAAQVTFAGLAVQGATPTWTRATGTCASTYCHARGGASPSPVWTQTGLDCNSCHTSPPSETNHSNYHWGLPCATCHPGYTSTTAAAATHVNGQKDVTNPRTGTPWTAGWTDCGPCHSN